MRVRRERRPAKVRSITQEWSTGLSFDFRVIAAHPSFGRRRFSEPEAHPALGPGGVQNFMKYRIALRSLISFGFMFP